MHKQDEAKLMQKQWHEWQPRGVLLRYQNGELSPAQRQRWERHLANCAECQRRVDAQEAAGQILARQMPGRNALASHDAQRMFTTAKMQAQAQTRNNERTLYRRGMGALATAAACACIGVWTAHWKGEQRPSNAEFAATPTIVSHPNKGNSAAASDSAPRIIISKSKFSGNTSIAATSRIAVPHSVNQKRKTARRVAAGIRMSNSKYPLNHRRRLLALATSIASGQSLKNRLMSHQTAASNRAMENAGNALEQSGMENMKNAPALYTSSESVGLLAQNLRGLSPDSHLLVSVTDVVEAQDADEVTGEGTAENSHKPTLESSASDRDMSGVATVSALQVDDTGVEVWKYCSVAQNKEGRTTVRRGAAWQIGRNPMSSLIVTTETPPTQQRNN